MYSILDLLWAFLVGILFIFMFLFQKRTFPSQYFSMAEIILDRTVTVKMILVRMILIFLFGAVAQFIFKDASMVLLGVIIGSILIVWPVILNPRQIFIDTPKGIEILLFYILYLIFIATSFSIAYVAISFLPEVTDFTFESLKDFAKDNVWPILFLLFGGSSENKIGQVLDRKILKRVEKESEEYFREMSESEDKKGEYEENIQ